MSNLALFTILETVNFDRKQEKKKEKKEGTMNSLMK